jgi:hypothetical protein
MSVDGREVGGEDKRTGLGGDLRNLSREELKAKQTVEGDVWVE